MGCLLFCLVVPVLIVLWILIALIVKVSRWIVFPVFQFLAGILIGAFAGAIFGRSIGLILWWFGIDQLIVNLPFIDKSLDKPSIFYAILIVNGIWAIAMDFIQTMIGW